MSNPGKNTYGQILKSSALIGSSSALNIGFGMVRTKAMAMLLGPAGFGLMSLYTSVSDLTRSLAGLGVNVSGVRQIAEAAGTGDEQKLARTVTTLRRVAFYSGALGALLLVVFCRQVSQWTFRDANHASAIALLAVAVFFADVSAGQMALVQGMRRIADLARLNVLGAFWGTALSIPIVYFCRPHENGVVPALVCVAAMGILTSWWYARKVKVQRPAMSMREVMDEASALLKLGLVFMVSALISTGLAPYLVRVILMRNIGLDAAGYYQSAWTLGGLYVGYILSAMGADFYPRLTAVANDNSQCNRLVNEQTEISLLLAGPGVLATLTFTPIVIQLFYSAKFGPAVETLRWICLGMLLRVASWPMGFILVAKGERKLFFWTEVLAGMVNVALIWAGVAMLGLQGAGIGFSASYLIYWIGIYAVVRQLSGFRWSTANKRMASVFIPMLVLVFVSKYAFARIPAAGEAFGALITVLAGIYALKTLCGLIPVQRLPKPARSMVVLFRLAPAVLPVQLAQAGAVETKETF